MVTERDKGYEGDSTGYQAGTASPYTWDGGYDVGVDLQRNRVIIYYPPETASEVSSLAELFGPIVELEQSGKATPACTRLDCRYQVRGGLTLKDGSSIPSCTSGFTVAQGSTWGVMTAGHCSPNAWRHGSGSGEALGSTTGRIVYGRSDSLWIATNPQWLEPPWVYLDSGNQASIINGTQLYRDIYGGFPTLKSGRSTGTDYGTVVIANYSPSYVPRSNSFVTFSYDTLGGDSGGSVINNNTAIGIVSGITPQGKGIVGHIEYQQDQLLVRVRT